MQKQLMAAGSGDVWKSGGQLEELRRRNISLRLVSCVSASLSSNSGICGRHENEMWVAMRDRNPRAKNYNRVFKDFICLRTGLYGFLDG
jgi:hypothetical protein